MKNPLPKPQKQSTVERAKSFFALKPVTIGNYIFLLASIIIFLIAKAVFTTEEVDSVAALADRALSNLQNTDYIQLFKNALVAAWATTDDESFLVELFSPLFFIIGIVEFNFFERIIQHLAKKESLLDWIVYFIAACFLQVAIQWSFSGSASIKYIPELITLVLWAFLRIFQIGVIVFLLGLVSTIAIPLVCMFFPESIRSKAESLFDDITGTDSNFGMSLFWVFGAIIAVGVVLGIVVAVLIAVVIMLILSAILARIMMSLLSLIDLGRFSILIPMVVALSVAWLNNKALKVVWLISYATRIDWILGGFAVLCFAMRVYVGLMG